MPKFSVHYTYAVDKYVVIKAPTPEIAERIVEDAWKAGVLDTLSPVQLSVGDFEILYTKKRQPAPVPLKSVTSTGPIAISEDAE